MVISPPSLFEPNHLEGFTQLNSMLFTSEVFWLHLYKLPFFYMSKKYGELNMDVDTDDTK